MNLYRLSKFMPLRFTSEYDWAQDGIPIGHDRASWWQWRGHVWRHRVNGRPWQHDRVNWWTRGEVGP